MGVEAKAWITGEYPNQEIHFELPSGPKGDPGGLTSATVLTTEDLNSVKTPGFYKQGSPGGASLSRNYPVTDFGSLMVYEYGYVVGTHLVQEYTPFNNILKGVYAKYIRANSAGGWSPWQLMSTTKVDKSMGTRIFVNDGSNDHMVYGDTGYRDVSTMLPEGLTKSIAGNSFTPTIRRVNGTVTLDLYLDVAVDAPVTTTILTIPSGFRQRSTISRPNLMWIDKFSVGRQLPSEQLSWYLSREAVRTSGAVPQNSTLMFTATWDTRDPWPTILPGTPL